MADITVDWGDTKIIYVPKSFSTLIQSSPFEIRELDLNDLRISLKDAEDSEEGMCAPHTHNHNTIVTVGGVTLARVIEILDPYTITFEDGAYGINLVGANSNVADKTNLNSVQIRSANSAGLIQVSGGSALTVEQDAKLMGLPDATLTTEEHTQLMDIPLTSSGLTPTQDAKLMGLPDVASIENVVLDAQTTDHQSTGSIGKAIASAGSAGDPWATPMSSYTDTTTFGGFVSKKLLTLAKFLGLK